MPLGRNFAKAVVASGFANLADGVLWVALPLLAVQLTRSPLLIAGVTVAARLPWLLAPVAGAFADRLDRRQSMLRVNLVRTVLLGGLALAVATDLATLAMLYAVAVLLGIGETLFDTSAQSLLPALVSRDDLTRANSRLYAVELVANEFIGPPLGGLLAAAGLAIALGLPAAAYLVGAGCLALIVGSFRAAGAGPAGSTRLRDDIAEGARFVWRHPLLRPLAVMLGVQNMAFAAVYSVFVLFAVAPGPMGLTKTGFGILVAAEGVGALTGSSLAVLAERRPDRHGPPPDQPVAGVHPPEQPVGGDPLAQRDRDHIPEHDPGAAGHHRGSDGDRQGGDHEHDQADPVEDDAEDERADAAQAPLDADGQPAAQSDPIPRVAVSTP